jgi:hypothetical protein
VSRSVQATCRYFLRVFGPARSVVSSPQMTRARMSSARIAVFAVATALAARSSSACTHPPDGRVPDIDSMMSAQPFLTSPGSSITSTAQDRPGAR